MPSAEDTSPEDVGRALALLDTLFSCAPVGLAFIDAGLRYVRINDYLAVVNGIPPEGHVGRTVSEVVPELAPTVEPLFRRVLETCEPVLDVEVSGETAAAPGVMRHWLTNYYPVRPGGGAPVGIGVVVTEITGRRLAEERLRRAQRAARLGTWDWDLTSNTVTWSEGIYELLGLAPGSFEPSLDRWLEFVLPEDAEQTRKAAEDAIALGGDFAADFRVRRTDGEVRWLAAIGQVESVDGGAPRRMAGVNIDITERKLAEVRLRESEDRYQQLVELSPDAVAVHSDGVVLFINTAGARLLGAESPGQIVGRPITEFIHADYHDLIRTRLEKMAAGEPQPPVEVRFIRLDGTEIYGELASVRLTYQGKPAVQAVIRDLTLRRQAEEERERLLREAQEANRHKDEFLATLSHELRTPLTSILGWAHLLRAGNVPAGGAAAALETIERNARAQSQLVEDLLDVSRIVTGKLRLEVRPVDPASFIDPAVEVVRPAAEAKGVRLQKVSDGGAVVVTADPARLQQVVWNLLSNAIKFTPAGGVVQVALRRVNSEVEIAVSDTGAGIAPEFLPHVFERFRQANMGTTRRYGGLGLGLAIVRHLVELHGGTVRAQSGGEGAGATFTVSLPATHVLCEEVEGRPARPQTRDALAAQECPERLDGLRVLVVDDEADTREMLGAWLGRCGAEVTAVSSAREALEALGRARFDVLVSDIGMPGEDGYELIRRVRALSPEDSGRTPAVALTAYAGADDRLRAMRAGFDAHVAKPVELVELVVVVANLLGRMRQP